MEFLVGLLTIFVIAIMLKLGINPLDVIVSAFMLCIFVLFAVMVIASVGSCVIGAFQ